MHKQPWIGKPFTEITFILLPPFVSLAIIFLFPSLFKNSRDMPETAWIILILLIDVSHVYSTLYRTYFDPEALNRQRFLLWVIPVAGFVAGAMLYSLNSLYFWRILAYVAVFHFVRQQYGFMRVYSRKERTKRRFILTDKITIYTAAVYPMIYWHLSGPRNFNWFIENDFVFYKSQSLLTFFTFLYILILVVYVIKEALQITTTGRFNIPRISVITGTIISWYVGIVYFNGDMAFTLLNVVSHGIPYMALIWIFGKKTYTQPEKGSRFLKLVFSRYGFIIFVLLITLFAVIEEGLWDMAVWKEHDALFNTAGLSRYILNDQLLSIIVPLLALPQITHYVLDGFIWKIKQDEFKWNNEITQ